MNPLLHSRHGRVMTVGILVLFFAMQLIVPFSYADNSPIQIGIEYTWNTRASFFTPFPSVGIVAQKPYPDSITWGALQPDLAKPINWAPLDKYIQTYQQAGFTTTVIALQACHSKYGTPQSVYHIPQAQYMDAYLNFVYSVVARYNMKSPSGVRMSGLKYSVTIFEVGVELSSYEPEPVTDYINLLSKVYPVIKQANSDAQVANAAFLTTTAFDSNPVPGPGAYEKSFKLMNSKINPYHGLADNRAILDRPDLFDLVDIHSIGDPNEIDKMVTWLNWEMDQRRYRKEIIVSDSMTTPFIAWGIATDPSNPFKGAVILPAVETDRPRLAAFFNKLIAKDPATLQWTQMFCGEDAVKKTVIAAANDVSLIDLSFTEDVWQLQTSQFGAGAGTSPWSGLMQVTLKGFTPQVTMRQTFWDLAQLSAHINGYKSVQRVDMGDPNIRVYQFTMNDGKNMYVAWLDAGKLLLPGDPVPTTTITFPSIVPSVTVENLITAPQNVYPAQAVKTVVNRNGSGTISVKLSDVPVFIYY